MKKNWTFFGENWLNRWMVPHSTLWLVSGTLFYNIIKEFSDPPIQNLTGVSSLFSVASSFSVKYLFKIFIFLFIDIK
jgi:hypothetical protein